MIKVIKNEVFGNTQLQLAYSSTPICGGHYIVRTMVEGNVERQKDAMSLDAANDCYYNSKIYLLKKQ